MKRLIALTLLIAAVPAWPQPAVTVLTDRAASEDVAASMIVTGVILSREDSALSSELEGRLTWIAEAGDRVSAGAVVARLDTHVLELQRQTREAEIERLRANLAWLDRQTGRLQELATRNNTAASELDEIRSNQRMLVQEINQASVALERSAYDLQRAEIRAPFSGIIVNRSTSIGEYVTVGRPLLRLVNTQAAEVSVTAPLQLADFVRAGDKVAVSNKGKLGEGFIRSIISVGDSRSHMMELRITPEEDNWYIGEAVSVSLPASHREILTTVDRDALVLRDNNSFIFIVDEEGIAERVAVELGSGFGNRIAVSGRVLPGDEVVIRGAERLRPGQKVDRLKNQLSMR